MPEGDASTLAINTAYGTQTFRELDSSLWDDINCHGYVFMRNDKPSEWLTDTYAYTDNIIKITSGDYSITIQNDYSNYVKADFEAWMAKNNYTFTLETDFSGNGESRTLQDNQYRVVLRTGLHRIPGHFNLYYDYHFWYQTYDGRWANKHGFKATSVSAPVLLPKGTTPFSTGSSGWDLTIGEYVYNDFYDNAIYSYIITID